MHSRIHPVTCKLASLFHVARERYRQDTKVRFGLFALLADGVGLALVFYLTQEGYLGSITANVAVSKGMAPIGLALNSLAITGRLIPTKEHAANWLNGWLTTSPLNTAALVLLLSTVSVSGVSARLLVGLAFFPIDYALKRYVIFGKGGQILRCYLFTACANFQIGALLKTDGPGEFPGPIFYKLSKPGSFHRFKFSQAEPGRPPVEMR